MRIIYGPREGPTYRRQKELSREKLGLISNFSGAINGVDPAISTFFSQSWVCVRNWLYSKALPSPWLLRKSENFLHHVAVQDPSKVLCRLSMEMVHEVNISFQPHVLEVGQRIMSWKTSCAAYPGNFQLLPDRGVRSFRFPSEQMQSVVLMHLEEPSWSAGLCTG